MRFYPVSITNARTNNTAPPVITRVNFPSCMTEEQTSLCTSKGMSSSFAGLQGADLCAVATRESLFHRFTPLDQDTSQSPKTPGAVFHCASSGQYYVFCVPSATDQQTHIYTVQHLSGDTRHPDATANLCSSSARQFLNQAWLFLSSQDFFTP